MGRNPLKINQNYFDVESINMYYVLGAWYASGTSKIKKYEKDDETVSEYKGIRFHSRVKGLVGLIQKELQSEQGCLSYSGKKRYSNWFESSGVPTLYDKLEELGLGISIGDRVFPDVPEKYIRHFLRGFIEAKGCIRSGKKSTIMEIKLNPGFLGSLHEVLKTYAHVEGGGNKKDLLLYNTTDVARISDFIYKDIKRTDLRVTYRKIILQKARTQL